MSNVLKQIESKGKKQKNKGKYYPNKLPHGGQLQIDWDKDFAERFIRAINFPPHPPAYVCVDGDNVNVQNVNDFMRLKNGKDFIMQMRPWIGEEEEDAINNYMQSDGFLTEYKLTEEFERSIMQIHICKICMAVNNGTIRPP